VCNGDGPPGRWWSLLGDPVLDRLVQDALIANTDLRVAAANLRQARALLRETRAGRLPTTQIRAGAQASRASEVTTGGVPGGQDVQDSYDVGLDVNYQIDLFGRVTRAIEVRRAHGDAVQAAFDTTRISVAAETARAYLEVCSLSRQLSVAQETVRIQQETYDLSRRLLEGGRFTALETSQAASLLEATRATIPTLEGQRLSAAYRLSILTGRPPAAFPLEITNAPARRRSRRRSRSAMARLCSPAAPTFVRPSGGWRPRLRGSVSRPRISIPASASAVRSARPRPRRAACSPAAASASASGHCCRLTSRT